jgi:ribosomal protein S12 methylthiotransferase
LPDAFTQEEKDERAETVMEAQQEISLAMNSEKVGKTFKVLFDRVEGGYFVGRTEFDSPEVDNEVLVDKTTNYARIGDFANVEITGAEEFDLFGKIIT